MKGHLWYLLFQTRHLVAQGLNHLMQPSVLKTDLIFLLCHAILICNPLFLIKPIISSLLFQKFWFTVIQLLLEVTLGFLAALQLLILFLQSFSEFCKIIFESFCLLDHFWLLQFNWLYLLLVLSFNLSDSLFSDVKFLGERVNSLFCLIFYILSRLICNT